MTVENGRVTQVAGDKNHPSNAGRLCTKGNSCAQALTHDDRASTAYTRSHPSHNWQATPVAQALQATAQQLQRIIQQHGPDAFAFYISGQMSLEAQYLANKLCKGFIKSQYIESNSRLCMASAGAGYKQSLGADAPPGSYEDFDHTDLFVVMGANMADCHPILFLRMMDRVKAGAKLIVVDPRRNGTADKAHLYLPIKPGTDLALLNGWLNWLLQNGHVDAAFIDTYTQGWADMPGFLAHYTLAHVAEITGLSPEQIEHSARLIAQAPAFITCWTMGLNQSTHGTWHTNAICNLHLATGQICRKGSGPFSLTGQPNAMGGREMGYMGPGLPGQRSALVAEDRAFIEQLWQLPAGSLRREGGQGTIDLFQRMKTGAIKACWIICTNPVASVGNRQTVIDGLSACELVISQDAFISTETNRYAHVLLPGALWAEAEGVMINSERNLTLMQQALNPPGEALPDWRIIADIACAMGYSHAFSYSSAAEVFDEIRRAANPNTGYNLSGASHERLRQSPLQWPIAPNGGPRNPIRYLNTGQHQPLKTTDTGDTPALVFATASGKAQFFARPYTPPAELPCADFPYVLNTGRVQHQWHTLTKTGKIATLNKLNPGPFVEIHPQDAAALGLQKGDRLTLRSRRGQACLPAVITNRVNPGEVFAPFHWNDEWGQQLAINALTQDAVDATSLQPELKCCAVALSRAAPALIASDATHPELPTMPTALAPLLGLSSPQPPDFSPQELLYVQGFLAAAHSHYTPANGLPCLPATAPLSAAVRAYVEGVLDGLFSRHQAPAEGPLIRVAWASTTGNAEDFGQQLSQQLRQAGFSVTATGMDALNLDDLAQGAPVILLASTFGDGDAPDSASAFWQALQSPKAPPLNNTPFAVLAFGDSNYQYFCGFGKQLDARLEALGGQRLLPRADCEPDYQDTASAWLAQLLQALGQASEPSAATEPSTSAAMGYTKQNPFPSTLLHNQRLNGEGSEKETRHYIFNLEGSGLQYQAGDALGLWPQNPPQRVQPLLQLLQLNGNAQVQVKNQAPMPLSQALTQYLDITRPHTDLLRHLAQQHPGLQALLQPENAPALQQWLRNKHLVDVLAEYPLAFTPQGLVDALKRLQPRLYSIASSPKCHPQQVHLTVNTLRYSHNGQPRGGLCSSFLADLQPQHPIGLFIQPSAHFHPPENPNTPLIMVGPGTGIAPFIGFLQDRKASAAPGKNWLFFGEQRAATDFYFQQELTQLQQDGYLHRLNTAFSRDQSEKRYVQHDILDQGAEVWRWLEEGAYFCICGSATPMAKDVETALCQVIAQQGNMTPEAAKDYVAKMAQQKRYLKDVY